MSNKDKGCKDDVFPMKNRIKCQWQKLTEFVAAVKHLQFEKNLKA